MNFFINRPVFAIILNCLIIFVGWLGLQSLEVREYPEITLPIVSVNTFYPNASAALMESDITNILEESLAEVPGLDNMITNISQGNSSIMLFLKQGVSIDKTMTFVREAVSKAKWGLPKDIQDPIIERLDRCRQGPSFMMLSVISTERKVEDLTHFVNLTIRNRLRSIEGIASVGVMGSPYMLKVTLDSKAMYQNGVNVDDIISALKLHHISLPAGKLQNKTTINFDLKMAKVVDFEELLVKNIPLKYLAHVERAVDNTSSFVAFNGNPGVMLFLDLASDANQLKASKDVHEAIKHLDLPEDVAIKIIADKADFIRQSLGNIWRSIAEACMLIPIVLYLFLGTWRASLIPLVTIPISLMGTFCALKFLGFSINVMTLLALVLAIGMVVDDAIVVLENVDRHMKKGLSPFKAAIKGSSEVSFAIIAMTFTLSSVYLPIVFIKDIGAQLFIEFAAALAVSIIISGLTALTLTPLMCVTFLKKNENHTPWFNQYLSPMLEKYNLLISRLSNKIVLYSGGAIVVLILFVGFMLPKEIITPEDRGLVGAYIEGGGRNLEENIQAVNKIEQIIGEIPEAADSIAMANLGDGNMIFQLKPYNKRKRSAKKIVEHIKGKTRDIPSIDVYPWSIESGIPGYRPGPKNITFVLKTMDSYADLFQKAEHIKKTLNEKFDGVEHDLNLNASAYDIVLDRLKLSQTGLLPSQVSQTLQTYCGGLDLYDYYQDMIRYPMRIMGDTMPWALDEVYMTTAKGIRVPIAQFATLKNTALPSKLTHYDQMRAVEMSIPFKGNIATSMKKLSSIMKSENISFTWTGNAKGYLESSSTMLWMLVMALIFIYAVLAVQFESFIDPLIIIVTVPLGIVGALLGLWMTGCSLNVYSYIGLITLIGVITKHGILIVEFSNQKIKDGKGIAEAVHEACMLRFRPIIMTSMTLILGTLPLMITGGAGSENRFVIGVTLIFGMLIGTFLTLTLLPFVFQMVRQKLIK